MDTWLPGRVCLPGSHGYTRHSSPPKRGQLGRQQPWGADDINPPQTPHIIFAGILYLWSFHISSDARSQQLQVLESTCPLLSILFSPTPTPPREPSGNPMNALMQRKVEGTHCQGLYSPGNYPLPGGLIQNVLSLWRTNHTPNQANSRGDGE